MIRKTIRLMTTAAMLLAFGIASPLIADEKTQPPSQPNILFILLDDLGKEWISCYGAEDIKTPNIDALAAGE